MRNRAMRMSETCAIQGCGKNRTEHAKAEQAGMTHHRFTTDPEGLEFKEGGKSPKELRGNQQTSRGRVRDGGSIGDPVLRFLLIQQKIITPEQLDEVEKILRATGAISTRA